MATLKKIDAMHKQFGKVDEKRCGDCCNLIVREYGNRYFKCSVYGMSHSTSTDWAKKWTACGMFNKEREPGNHRALSLRVLDNEPMNGQLEIEED